MNAKIPVILALIFCTGALGSAGAAGRKPPLVDIPPPPGLNDPGVDTSSVAAEQENAASPTEPVTDDPLAPLPKPDNRLVRDKASRDRAATAERAANSEVTTRQQGNDTVEEYRQNGRVWMVKIRQPNGPTQTFYADDGSGRLVRDPKEGPVSPVYFTIYEWK